MTQEAAPTACVARECRCRLACQRRLRIPGILRFLPTYLAIDSNHPRY